MNYENSYLLEIRENRIFTISKLVFFSQYHFFETFIFYQASTVVKTVRTSFIFISTMNQYAVFSIIYKITSSDTFSPVIILESSFFLNLQYYILIVLLKCDLFFFQRIIEIEIFLIFIFFIFLIFFFSKNYVI